VPGADAAPRDGLSREEPSTSPCAGGGRLLRAGAAGVGVLLVAELVARLALSAWGTPSSYDAPRNPHFRRGWVEFTAPPPEPRGHPLVVVVTHSQGYFRETTDARSAYPAQLEELLRAQRGLEGAEVLNWSIDGGRALEAVLLVARALEHDPDLILYATGPDVYREDAFSRRPSYWVSDAWKLCHRSEVRRRLSGAPLQACRGEAALGWMRSHLALFWVRSALFEQRVDAWTLWGTPRGDTAPVATPKRSWRMRFHEPAFVAALAAVRQVVEAAAVESRSSARSPLDRVAAKPRLVFLASPHSRAHSDPETLRLGDRMLELAARTLPTTTTILDARELVPAERFYDAVHVDREGQRQLATWLAPRLLTALDAP
jgi:hypothetical protein